MSWYVVGATYYNDSDLTDTTVKQSMTFDTAVILKAVRIWLIFYNDPTFTSLNMKIYSESLALLHTSTNSQVKADLLTDDYGVKETYFEFANVNLAKDTPYYFVLNASGYTGASESTHIAWRNTYPDQYYPVTPALDGLNLDVYPLTIYPIFARFDEP